MHAMRVSCNTAQPRPNPDVRVGRQAVLRSLTAAALTALPLPLLPHPSAAATLQVQYTDAEWAARLPPLSYRVLRKKATERPFTSPLNAEGRAGTFVCAGCANPLYDSTTKFDSGTGWPSFYASLPNAVIESPDTSIPFLPRTEISCASCGGHLGHVFPDGPAPTGLRYCMNGAALSFVPKATA